MKTAEIDLASGLHDILAAKKGPRPQHVNRISSLDDPCVRRLYYARAAWDKGSPIDDTLQGIFETGTILEPVIGRILSEVGEAGRPPWRIVGSQVRTRDSLLAKYEISGQIDGFLEAANGNGTWTTLGVVDIKTMSAHSFAAVREYEDLARYPWTRRWRGQLMLYALAHDLERCFILGVNKTNLYDMRLIEFPLDMEYCEGLLKKAEVVNEAIASGEPPAGVNDPDICPDCPWYAFCAPDLATGGRLTISTSEELAAVLDRLEELKATKAEIASLEAERDSMLLPSENVACGDWLVTWKKLEIHYKAQEARTVEQWRKKIVRAAGPKQGGKT